MKVFHVLTLLILFSAGTIQAQTQLSPDEFESNIKKGKDVQLIDVRTPGEYKDGHLANSKNIDYRSEDFAARVSELDKSKPVYVYCLSGGRSAAAAKTLHEKGFSEVYDMKGGYVKWSAAGKEVAGVSEANSKRGMSEADFTKLVSSKDVVLIDFYAKWCAPCVKMMPTVKKLTKEYAGKAKIETIDYDANKELAKELGVDEIPAFILYKNGKPISRKNGLLSERDFRQLLDSNL